MNNFCSIFSKKLLKNCLVFFVVPAILLVACGAPTDDADAAAKAAAAKLPAETPVKTWDKAFEHMLTALHAPYADGDCFFKAGGPVSNTTVVGGGTIMKIMGKNLVVDSSGKFKTPAIGTGSFSITTKTGAAGIIVPAAAYAVGNNMAGVLIEYNKFQPAGSNVMIDGKIGLNGMNAAVGLAMFHAAAGAVVAEPSHGGILKITGPGYTADLSFAKTNGAATKAAAATPAALVAAGNGSPDNFTVKALGKACDVGGANGAAGDANGEPFGGGNHVGAVTTGAFAKVGDDPAVRERVVVKFKFNLKENIVLVGHGNDDKGQALMKKLVSVKKSAPVADVN